jgi:hypothetical protein
MNDYDTIVRFDVVDGQIQVVKRRRSNMSYATNPPRPVPDTIWRETYGVVDGRICLVNSEVANHKPAHNVPESITFEGEA